MSDIEVVAKAIEQADPLRMQHRQSKSEYLYDYRRMAHAAIDALGITEEKGNEPLEHVLEDAIWHALDAEQGAPHSGVDMAYVVNDVIARLAAAGYSIVQSCAAPPLTNLT